MVADLREMHENQGLLEERIDKFELTGRGKKAALRRSIKKIRIYHWQLFDFRVRNAAAVLRVHVLPLF